MNKPRTVTLVLMGDWFLDFMILDALGFSLEGVREEEALVWVSDEQRLNLNERGGCY